MTQNNLGTALRTLGQREEDTGRLKQALEAHRHALVVYSRERYPFQWALTLENSGIALGTLGERERDPLLLEQSATAIRDALKVFEAFGSTFNISKARSNLDLANRLLAELRGSSVTSHPPDGRSCEGFRIPAAKHQFRDSSPPARCG